MELTEAELQKLRKAEADLRNAVSLEVLAEAGLAGLTHLDQILERSIWISFMQAPDEEETLPIIVTTRVVAWAAEHNIEFEGALTIQLHLPQGVCDGNGCPLLFVWHVQGYVNADSSPQWLVELEGRDSTYCLINLI